MGVKVSPLEEILKKIYSAQESLNEAAELIAHLNLEHKTDNLTNLGQAFAFIAVVERGIYNIDPSLESYDEDEEPDGDPDKEAQKLISKLTDPQIDEIDEYLLKMATNQFRKVAMIVGLAMSEQPNRIKGIPDVYYAQRVKRLVNLGLLEAEGNLDYMRYSEVRLAQKKCITSR